MARRRKPGRPKGSKSKKKRAKPVVTIRKRLEKPSISKVRQQLKKEKDPRVKSRLRYAFGAATVRAEERDRDIQTEKALRKSGLTRSRFEEAKEGLKSYPAAIGGLFRKKDPYSKKKTKQRQMATRKVLGAIGVVEGGGQAGPGRPRGTYKHGMPIHVYKQMIRDKAMKERIFQQQKLQALQRRGISPQAYQQMQMARTQQQPQQFQEQVEAQMPEDDGGYRETPEQIRAQVNDELAFRKWAKDRTISPTTKNILLHLMRTQNKARTDDVENQRRIMERKMIADQSNLMRARNLFGPDSNKLDILEEKGNILQAPNTFSENGERILDTQGRPSILETRRAGNSLF